MIFWEYYSFKSNNLPLLGNGHKDLDELNRLGGLGWELVWVQENKPYVAGFNFVIQWTTSKFHKEITYYLKRQIINSLE